MDRRRRHADVTFRQTNSNVADADVTFRQTNSNVADADVTQTSRSGRRTVMWQTQMSRPTDADVTFGRRRRHVRQTQTSRSVRRDDVTALYYWTRANAIKHVLCESKMSQTHCRRSMCETGVRARAIALTAAPVDLKMNANHFSFSVSVGELNPS